MATVLVCDDEKEIVSAICIYLKGEGYETRTAENGEEAIGMTIRFLRCLTITSRITETISPPTS